MVLMMRADYNTAGVDGRATGETAVLLTKRLQPVSLLLTSSLRIGVGLYCPSKWA